MKVLMINHFPLEGSGSGTYTKNLAVHLSQLGHEVCIILPENSSNFNQVENIKLHPVYFTDKEEIEGALPFNFPCFTSHPRSIKTFKDLTDEELNMYLVAFKDAIKNEVETFKPDIIHGQHVWILSCLASEYDIPLVLTAHGTDLMGYDKWPEFRKYADIAMDKCRNVISISKDNCELLEKIFPDHKDKIVMMRNGYDPNVFYPTDIDKDELLNSYNISKDKYENKKIITFVGKLANFKGVDILLDAAKIYEDRQDSITLIIGDGDEKEKLHRQSEELNLKSVYFLGNVNQKELKKFYNIANVSVVPSRREPFGLVAIEAMACGTPVVATNQGGLPDFVNDKVGKLVEPEDAQDLARGILDVMNRYSKDDYLNWRNDIHDYARMHYAQDKIIEELDDLYHRALHQ